MFVLSFMLCAVHRRRYIRKQHSIRSSTLWHCFVSQTCLPVLSVYTSFSISVFVIRNSLLGYSNNSDNSYNIYTNVNTDIM